MNQYSHTRAKISGPGMPPPPKVIPRMKHRDDLRWTLVIRELPKPGSGIAIEVLFQPHPIEPSAVGFYEIPHGPLLAIMVDPGMEPNAWRVENSITGEVYRQGKDYRRAFPGSPR